MRIERLGRYEISEEVGRGAMGVVYKAADPLLDRTVAIKTISLVNSDNADFEERFFREAKSAGRLNHPNIVTVYDAGKDGEIAYIAMEFLEGREFRSILSDRPPISTDLIADIIAQVAEGLDYAHQNQVVHRDVKPTNIMVLKNNVAKITDFGIALIPSGAKTMTGMILGSPKYMSPEQIVGERVDRRSDVFSLGVVLYEALTGRAPFRGSNVSAIMYKIINDMPEPPSTLGLQSDDPQDVANQIYREIPLSLDYIVAKALAKHPDDRYQTALEFAQDLRKFRDIDAKVPEVEAPRTLERRAGRRNSGDDTLLVRRPPLPTAGLRDNDAVLPDATAVVNRPIPRPDLEETMVVELEAAPAHPDLVALDNRPNEDQIEDVADATVFIDHRDQHETVDIHNDATMVVMPTAEPPATAPAPTEPQAPVNLTKSIPSEAAAAEPPVTPTAESPAAEPLVDSDPTIVSAPPAVAGEPAATPRKGLAAVFGAGIVLAIGVGAWLAGRDDPNSVSPNMPAVSTQTTVSTAPKVAKAPSEPVAASTQPTPLAASTQATPVAAVSTQATEPANPAEMAVVNFGVAPWGEVWVDGNNMGVAPPLVDLKLPPGKHRIEIRNPGHEPFIKEFELKPKTITKIKHKFRG